MHKRQLIRRSIGRPAVLSCLTLFCALLLASTAAHSDDDSTAPRARQPHLVRDIAPKTSDGLINVVVEIPAGTNAKWEVQKDSGLLEWEQRDGRPRIVRYLPYPGNYGMVPQTLLPKELGGDGDPLDVIVLGPALTRGSVVAARLIGVLKLLDRGEQDDKLIAVLPGGPFGNVTDLAELDANYHGISDILRLWFSNYKGPGKMSAKGFGDRAKATEILEAAVAAYPRHED